MLPFLQPNTLKVVTSDRLQELVAMPNFYAFKSSSWWPTSGYRENSNARLYAIGNWTGYWSSSRHTSNAYNAYNLYFDYNGNVNPSNNNNRSNGFPIRCIEDFTLTFLIEHL